MPHPYVQPEGEPLNGPKYPRVFSHPLAYLKGGEIKALEVREDEFTNWILLQNGEPILQSTHPEPIWRAYRERVISKEDAILAHGMGISLGDYPIREWPVSESPEMEEIRKEYRDRFFADYKL